MAGRPGSGQWHSLSKEITVNHLPGMIPASGGIQTSKRSLSLTSTFTEGFAWTKQVS